jgi:hypothetical protein
MAGPRLEQLKRAQGLLEAPELAELHRALDQLDSRMLQVLEASALVRAGVELDPAVLNQLGAEETALPELLAAMQAEQARLGQALQPFAEAARQRLLAALSLLRAPGGGAGLAKAQPLQVHEEVLDLLHVLENLGAAFPALLELRQTFAQLQALLGARDRASSPFLQTAISELAQTTAERLSQIQATLGATAYPFDHTEGRFSLVDYARAKEYDAEPARMTWLEAQSHLRMLFAVYYRVLGRLVAIARQSEARFEPAPGPA